MEETNKKTVEQQLEKEMRKLRTMADEVRVQTNLGAMDVRDKAQPHIEELEECLGKAKNDWDELTKASEGAWEELGKGLKLSLKEIQQSVEKAKQHFKPEED